MTETHLPEPPKTGRHRLDFFVAIAALTISAVSIFIARDTSQTMERLAHASFWPFLQLGSGNVRDDGVHAITFAMENVGTGPADANASVWTALDQARQGGRITMSTCYCSVFDECWIARTNEFPPQEVDRCGAEAPRGGARPSG